MTPHWSALLTSFCQVAFYITIGSITLLTYRKARQGLFQPMRTEVFKQQLELFSRITRLFAAKTWHDIHDDCGLKASADAAAAELLYDYAHICLGTELNTVSRPFSDRASFPAAIMGEDRLRNLSPVRRKDEPIPATKWADYKGPVVPLSREYLEFQSQIHALIESPLLPQRAVQLLSDYLGIVEQHIGGLVKGAGEFTKKLSEYYPDIAAVSEADISWLSARCHEPWGDVLPDKAKEIVLYTREYFAVDRFAREFSSA